MKFNIKTDLVKDISNDIIIIAVNDKNQINGNLQLPTSTNTYLSKILLTNDLGKDLGASLLVHGCSDFERILLTRISNEKTFNTKSLIKITSNITQVLKNLKIKKPLIPLEQFFNINIHAHSGT